MTCVLGIETATPFLSVAVAAAEGLLAERSVLGARLHSVRLVPFIRETLAEAGVGLSDLSGIAVSSGPGSFTGLRLGMITAKTLAQVLQIPVVGIPTLLALAAPLLPGETAVCAVLTSRREEVYAAVYGSTQNGARPLVPAFAASPAAVAERLKPFDRMVLTGEGAWAWKETFHEVLGSGVVFAPKVLQYPRGAVVAALGLSELGSGGGIDPLTLRPEYLRLPAVTGGSGKDG
ncbi:MAG: tRNA (adenosine(37)-N6)-threonylcarbamoyltransferase complex dimerization subunit type 1 TsaB [Bacillota bacterium]|nr:tRNA (adenosine(37)-N6)-threonylcarbamoyltransferase complex dimerization subunit type 1 TsaB [Thermoanaerobacteraceae bacterium]